MKKLMIAAAIVCAAAFAQAATFNWDFTSVALQDGDGTGMDGTLTVLINGSVAHTYTFAEGFTADDFVVAFDGPANVSWQLDTTSFGDGKTWEKVVSIADFAHPYPDGGSASSAEQSLFNLTGDLTNEAMSYGSLYFADGAAGAAENDWSAVPEPTSGLLLLIGVAGLALRRRRA